MPLISSVRGSYGAQGRFGKKGLSFRMGQSNTFPGKSAKEILVDWQSGLTAAAFGASTPSDGAYWIQPPGCPEPFQVYCNMSLEGGGWMLVLRLASEDFAADRAANSRFTGNWEGWTYSTKSQIDALGYSYTGANETDTFTPVFAYSPFNDVMVISSRASQSSKRVGWRHTNTINNMRSVTGGTSARTVGDSTLFGNPTNWLQSGMDIRPDTTPGSDAGTNRKVGFKINSDGSAGTGSGFIGGFTSPVGWTGAMIGYGRDDNTEGRSGGGIGVWMESGNWARMGHHYWGWGSGRSSAAWNAGDKSSPWYGQAVYVRELNTLTGSVPL
jgi:hypothetical protein